VVLLVPALLGLVLAIAAYPLSSLERSLETFLVGLQGWLDPVWGFLSDLLWLWALMLVAVALVRVRLVVVAQALAALVLGVVLALCASRIATGSWPELADAVFGTARAARFPATRVAEATAVIVTVAPHLTRPVRAFGGWLLLLGLARCGDQRLAAGDIRRSDDRDRWLRLPSGSHRERRSADRVSTTWRQSSLSSASYRARWRRPNGRSRVSSTFAESTPTVGRCSSRCTAATPTTLSSWRESGGDSGIAAPACRFVWAGSTPRSTRRS
jgi:signal transduction histidine kinase